MSATVMNKMQCCTLPEPPRLLRFQAWKPRRAPLEVLMRLGVAAVVAAALGLLVALAVVATPSAVEAIAVPPALATIELPRVVIHGQRWPLDACPVPVEPLASPCPVPLN